MLREVKLTDQNGQADFSASYTHFFDVSVLPPCGYYPTSALFRDVTGIGKAEFGFWPVDPEEQLARVRVLLWKDLNSDGKREPGEEVVNQKATLMFKAPGGADSNVYLGNSCGTVYVLLLESNITTNSISEPGTVGDAGAHGNTFYPSIEIPYNLGETTVYWEVK